MFKFKGISSQDMQVIIEEEEHFIARASQRYEMTEIEGRDGAIFETSGYSCVERPIYVQCLNTEKIDEILAWLDGEGEFEYKGRKTTARFYSQLEPQRNACIRIIDTTFIRDPFWTKAVDEYQTINETRYKEAQGEDITLKDSARYKFKELKVSGNSVQETREGYNLLNVKSILELKGNILLEISLEANKTYTIKIDNIVTDNVENSSFCIGLRESDNTFIQDLRMNYSAKKMTIVPKKDVQRIRIYSGYGASDSPLVTTTFTNFMIYEGIEDKQYEPYGAMPSPSYSSEIKNCGDNINYLDNSLIERGTINDSKGNEAQFADNAKRARFPSLIQLENNINTFTISCSENYSIAVAQYDDNNICLNSAGFANNYTFNKEENATQISIKFKKVDETSFTQEELKDIKCKLEKCTKASEYSKYDCGCIDLKVQNKNYFNINQNHVYSGATGVIEKNIITGTSKNTVGTSRIVYTLDNLKINTKYIVSLDCEMLQGANEGISSSVGVREGLTGGTYRNNKMLEKTTNVQHIEFEFNTSNFEVLYLWLYIRSNSNIADVVQVKYSNIMLREINTDDTFIEHEEQTVTFPLKQGQVLHDNDMLADDGVHYKRKTIVLDGTENWGLHKNSIFKLAIADIKPTSNFTLLGPINAISTHFKGITWREMYDTEAIGIAVHNTAKNIYISTEKTVTTVEQFKTWLAEQYANGTPVTIEYELQDEEIEAYTEEQQEAYDAMKELYSYQEVTHITCEDEIKTTQEVIYSIEPNIEVENEGNIASRPILKLIKTLDDYVDITINQVRFKYNFPQNENYVEIDCENKEVKYDNLNRNRQIEIGYEFPKLNVGNNEIVLNSGDCIIETKRKDRWL